ncbi:glutamine synthetase III [Desulfovibrio sp. OttesenSCG-928-O18]|nr:glutamine synthetase III [Desulfovibrio sp. OttesenSCG-928-O18]
MSESRSENRAKAIARIGKTRPLDRNINYIHEPVQDIYGSLVFDQSQMAARLPKDVFRNLQKTMRGDEPLDLSVADVVANAMKEWAVEMGATHYTHWFQPMTGVTAEKHDSFIEPTRDGKVINEFSGKMLIKGESDASSFPSGGLRSTFEARGYTAWDPCSPVFIQESLNGRTLCIPTAYCSYTGECLDRKTPLLRSNEALSREALRILRLFGDTTSTHVTATLGAEQEYFLVDRQLYLLRPDLVNTGRTLYGAKPPKGQELEDHYYGSIRGRILAFMMDLEKRLYRLGIPVKTRHNEAAPAQFELAPVFEEANIATDHNMLIMECLRGTARDHGLICLLHEKPFKDINGNGKHNNWSLSDSAGNNLFDPGDTPHENAQFLVFLAAMIRAVHRHAALLRMGTIGAGNDHRLGGFEAPPAIFSIYLGSQLEDVVESIVKGKSSKNRFGEVMRIGVSSLPPLPKDATDRNRTSPVAFTGNKFEFRAVGASQSTAPMVFLINTVMAASLDHFATELETAISKGQSLHDAAQKLLQKEFSKHMPVIFNGDNYSAEWPIEAAKRGLPNSPDTVSALKHFTDKEAIDVLGRYKVLSEREVRSRADILYEGYATTVTIEGRTALDMGRTIILPAVFAYQRDLAATVQALAASVGEDAAKNQKKLLQLISRHAASLITALDGLESALTKAAKHKHAPEKVAKACRDTIVPAMRACREEADALEVLVDDALWPLPKYRELLWIY